MLMLCTAAAAQSITGVWQGRLPVQDSPRVALKIANGDDGMLHGTLYLLDKGPTVVALTSVQFLAPELRIEQVNLDVSYRGRESADGKSIEGSWTEKGQSYPLTMAVAGPDALRTNGATIALPAMSETADPAFEVATIKPSAPDAKRQSFSLRTRQFAARNKTVKELIEFSYQTRGRLISGGAAWMDQTRFDIAAEPDAFGQPSVDQYRLMVRKMLSSRFGLQIHLVQQVFPVYALVREENAPALPHSDPVFDTGSIYVKQMPDGQSVGHFVGHTMPMFADILMNFIQDRQIVDETGLSGHFEFSMTVPTSATMGGDASGPEDDRADEFRRALRPLGLRLVPKREPLDVIVVDHVDAPSAN